MKHLVLLLGVGACLILSSCSDSGQGSADKAQIVAAPISAEAIETTEAAETTKSDTDTSDTETSTTAATTVTIRTSPRRTTTVTAGTSTEKTTVTKITTVETTTTTTLTVTTVTTTTVTDPPVTAADTTNTMVDAAPHYSIPEGRYDNYLFVGDSRTVGMSYYCSGEYIAKSAEGINWFWNNYDEITSYRNYNVVMLLGVNDLYHIWDYIDMYNNLPVEFTNNNRIILVSVNPCQNGYSHLNSSIDDFNWNLENNTSLKYEYIDTNEYLNYIGFSTTDGLHYTGGTYTDIYNAILYGY